MEQTSGLCHICLRVGRHTRALEDELFDFLDEICNFAILISKVQQAYCMECKRELRKFYEFRNKCVEANEILMQWKKKKAVKRKPLSILHTLLSQCNDSKPATSTPAQGSHILNIGPETIENSVDFHQNKCDYENDDKNENNERHPLIKQMEIKLESDDENEATVTEILEYDALNCTTYIYEETSVKTENNDVDKDSIRAKYINGSKDDVNNDDVDNYGVDKDDSRAEYHQRINDVANIADKESSNISAEYLSDTSLNSQDNIIDLVGFDYDKNEYSDTNLSSDDYISESIGGKPKKIKLMKKTLLELADVKIDSGDVESNVENIKVKSTIKRKKKQFCLETLKQKLTSIFDYNKEVKATDGTVVQRDVILNSLENIRTFTLKCLLSHIRRSQTFFTPKALNCLAKLQKQYEIKNEGFYDIEYMNSEEKVMEEFEKRKTYESYITAPFKCQLCYQGFKFAKLLENHKQLHEPSAGDIVCSVCQMRVPSNRRLMAHNQRNHRAVLRCRLCPFVNHYRKTMDNHANQHRGVRYECTMCSAVFKSCSALQSHLRRHKTEHACPFCAKTFVSDRGLEVHRYLKHKTETIPTDEGVLCETCNIKFTSKEVYEQHRRITHDEDTRVARTARTRRARSDRGLKRRLTCRVTETIPTDEGVLCETCNIKFTSKEVYEQHRRITHDEDARVARTARTRRARSDRGLNRRFTCRVCGVAGEGLPWLSEHHRAQHPGLPRAPPRLLCDECGKGFMRKIELELHLNVHTGVRPFACDQCPAKFYKALYLRDHSLRHGPPQFRCEYCGKSFHTKANLYIHTRVHVGDRRFKCEVCPAAFLHASSLREHVRGVHCRQRRVRKRPQRTTDAIDDKQLNKDN